MKGKILVPSEQVETVLKHAPNLGIKVLETSVITQDETSLLIKFSDHTNIFKLGRASVNNVKLSKSRKR